MANICALQLLVMMHVLSAKKTVFYKKWEGKDQLMANTLDLELTNLSFISKSAKDTLSVSQ